eukprot:TRINITY_DN9319_c0_g2_i3.p1 TRINITY_DN9319_c0_g2~~TRINITY_DN9319_c0_g2_i3.p1  ORF type:complete len:413 (+),score=121.09 TRINITY_DN9319_c0_g2_i3:44-1240(+)
MAFKMAEPEIFETDEAEVREGPIFENDADMTESTADDIITAGLDPSQAASHFKGRLIDASSADFSDGIGKRSVGYSTLSLAEDGAPDETIEEKYNRLRLEVTEFMAQLESVKSQQGGQTTEEDAAVAIRVAAQVQTLQTQLQQVRLDEMLGKSAPADSTPSADQDAVKRLMAAIAKVKGKDTSTTTSEGTTSDGKSMTYELIYTPEQARYQSLSRAAELEQRIAALERRLGTTSLASVGNFLEVEDATVGNTVMALAARVDALSESNLADLESRLTGVQTSLSAIQKASENASSTITPEDLVKIRSLYDITRQWMETAASVPQIVQRLKELRSLHEQAAEFSGTLTHMKTVQDEMRDRLANHDVTLKTLEQTFKDNAKTMEANFTSLEKRLQALMTKL